MAVARLRAALAAEDVVAPVVRPERLWPSQTLARWTFNRGLRSRRFLDVDAVLGVNGDGWMAADRWRAPFVVLIKARHGRCANAPEIACSASRISTHENALRT